jgi:hypothetical protein
LTFAADMAGIFDGRRDAGLPGIYISFAVFLPQILFQLHSQYDMNPIIHGRHLLDLLMFRTENKPVFHMLQIKGRKCLEV